ncbi:cysteine hydrolase family protein [Aurantimicrobium minutum]|uniref:cysteine hydrolase family protein n=1 Tax=Aurantimicrobium minutum TaxID=708131 RepID=UPI002473292D|nr:cysteine hydrolase family protein [Aurantimicrobium minutum]MDH6422961.1 nicotinamidase-related amidase [Aurantimicrobium minutum]
MTKNALVVIDVQNGFDDPRNGPRNNPNCETNVISLLEHWRSTGQPVVLVRHDSKKQGSPLAPGQSGNDLKPGIDGPHDLFVTKTVNSAFYGTPDLDAWLKNEDINAITVCGIMTNFCCETTARMGGNLGYDVTFVLDATHTFDKKDLEGNVIPAEEVARMTAANLHGEFATVRSTADVLAG